MSKNILNNLHLEINIAKKCHSGILNMRPIGLNKCTGYLPFCGSNCELKGVTILRNWLPCAIQSCGTQALVIPFSFLNIKGTLPGRRPFLIFKIFLQDYG